MSVIRYRFRSSKDDETIVFEGAGLHLWEVKYYILSSKKFSSLLSLAPTSGDRREVVGSSTAPTHNAKMSMLQDFDLIVSDSQTNEDFLDDNQIIHKNAVLLVRRVPRRKGKTKMHFYGDTLANKTVTGIDNLDNNLNKDEQSKIQKINQSAYENWTSQLNLRESFMSSKDQQHQQFLQTHHFHNKGTQGYQNRSSKVPGPNYICYKCGERGHFIQDCQLPSDGSKFTTRLKRVTGIPKSFLKPVSSLELAGDNASSEDKVSLKKTLISYDGSKVVFRPNIEEWKRFAALTGYDSAVNKDTNEDEDIYDVECE